MAAFEIYKKGQGKYVRIGTLLGAALLLGLGIEWLVTQVMVTTSVYIKAPVALAVLVLGAWLTSIAVNKPKYADFMISTESEMKKVIWPTKAEIINSTRLVIVMTLLLALMLFVVDLGFLKFFEAIHILPHAHHHLHGHH